MKKDFTQDYQNLRKEIIDTIASSIDEKGIINYHGDNDAINTTFTIEKNYISIWYVYKKQSRIGYEVAVEYEIEGNPNWDYARNLPIEVLLTIAETLDNPDIYDNEDE